MSKGGTRIEADQVQMAVDAAECVVETHRRLSQWLRVGQTLREVDGFVAETQAELGCKSCFLGYRIPKLPPFTSHACLSVNDCIVHGHARYLTRPLEPGDVLKIDIGVTRQGWIGDAAWTYAFGEPSPEVRHLMDCGKECLRRGIERMTPGRPLVDWARAVQEYVEGECGLHLIRGYGGHGYGRKLHTGPFISNTVPLYSGEWPDAYRTWEPGMLIAVEPMIAIGTGQTRSEPKAWPVYVADGSQSVHYEHDVLVTEDGPHVLTAGLEEIDDVILR